MDTNKSSHVTICAVRRNKSAQVVRKQLPLGPAAAKRVHRSQGDTQSQIVVNLDTKRTIPHIHYVALSRVTTIDGLYITNLCENKIAIDPKVIDEMKTLTEKNYNFASLHSKTSIKAESFLLECSFAA